MILRRLAEAIREQNWFTVVLEIFIVVVGIFIGLQVDDWNQARKDRALEQAYLARLVGEIRVDIDEFLEFERIFLTKAKIIEDLRDKPVAGLLSRPLDELMAALDYSAWKALPKIQSATFTELASSGRLALLRDAPLRGALSDYYVGYELMSGILGEPDGAYRELFFGALPGEIYIDWRLSKQLPDPARLGAALAALKSDPGFEGAANAEIAYAGSMVFYLRQFHGQAAALISRIGAPPDAAEARP